MAKTNPSGKEYSSGEASDSHDSQPPDDSPTLDPEAELQDKQIKLTQLKAAEKRLQDEIVRLTAHNVATKALEGSLSAAAGELVTTARNELRNYVDAGMKALDETTKSNIEKKRSAVDLDIEKAVTKYESALKDTVAKQKTVAAKQEALAAATDTYVKAKELPARVKQTSADLVTLRGTVESLVKSDKFVAAGFWLFELDKALTGAETLTGGRAAISKAWQDLETASTEMGAAADALSEAVARQTAFKTALEDARKNRVAKILDALKEPAGSKVASAA